VQHQIGKKKKHIELTLSTGNISASIRKAWKNGRRARRNLLGLSGEHGTKITGKPAPVVNIELEVGAKKGMKVIS